MTSKVCNTPDQRGEIKMFLIPSEIVKMEKLLVHTGQSQHEYDWLELLMAAH